MLQISAKVRDFCQQSRVRAHDYDREHIQYKRNGHIGVEQTERAYLRGSLLKRYNWFRATTPTLKFRGDLF